MSHTYTSLSELLVFESQAEGQIILDREVPGHILVVTDHFAYISGPTHNFAINGTGIIRSSKKCYE